MNNFFRVTQVLILIALTNFSRAALADSPAVDEEILGVTYNHQGLSFQVKSGGCTSKEDFQLLIQETNPMGLRLQRLNMDYCEADIPYGTMITFTWQELGLHTGGKFFIINQFALGRIVPFTP